jgi:hypothetical protein
VFLLLLAHQVIGIGVTNLAKNKKMVGGLTGGYSKEGGELFY